MVALRKSTTILALKGAYDHDPKRFAARANEPTPTDEIGPPPDHFAADARAVWMELTSMAHAGTLSRADRLWVEYATGVVMAMRRMTAAGEFDAKTGMRFEQVMGRMGMSPADRSRVSVVKNAEPDDPTAEFG